MLTHHRPFVFVARRVLLAVVLWFGLSLGVFAAVHYGPGEPLTLFTYTPEERALNAEYEARSFLEHYSIFMSGVARGDLGPALRGLPACKQECLDSAPRSKVDTGGLDE